jgi:glycosyltransferase involved in cell wall biosynthesis
MNQPFVSFIITSYNQAEYLEETLNSIVSQEGDLSYEMIIIDDCSKDGSADLIKSWIDRLKPEKSKVIFNETNIGLCKTLNKAISVSTGEWIKYIACDDIVETNYLLEIKDYLDRRNHEVAFICTDMSIINSSGEVLQNSNWEYSQVQVDENDINDFEKLLKGQYLNTPSVIYKKSLWEKIGGYDENLIFEDWDLYLRAKKIAQFGVIKKSLVRYRIHNHNMHLNFKTNARYVIDSILMLKKHLEEKTKPIIREKVLQEITNLIPIDENEALRIWEQEIDWLKCDTDNQSLVSVLIPVYNSEKYIDNAIKSILLQTYNNVEVIVVNDGSSDHSESLINKLVQTNNKVKYYSNPENLGISKTRNIALSYCNGEYIALLDSDDICAPNRIEKQVKFLKKNTEFKAVSSWKLEFGTNTPKLYKYKQDFETLKCVSIFYNPVSHAASMFISSALKDIGYDENYPYAEDYQMFLRFIQKYKISSLQETLYFYRIHKNQSIGSKNSLVIMQNEKKIASYIVSLYWNSKNSSDEDFYYKYISQEDKIKTANDFLLWDAFFRRLLKSSETNKFLDSDILLDYVFKNYWFINFTNTFSHFKIIELIRVLNSPYCKISTLSKLKYLTKKLTCSK